MGTVIPLCLYVVTAATTTAIANLDLVPYFGHIIRFHICRLAITATVFGTRRPAV